MPEFSRYRQPSSTESEVAQDLPDRSPELAPLEEIPCVPPTDSMKTHVESLEKRKVILFRDITKPLPEPLDVFFDIYSRIDESNIKVAEASPESCYIYMVPKIIPLQYIDIVPSSINKNSEDIIIDWISSKDYYSEKILDMILTVGNITKDHELVKNIVSLSDIQYVTEYLENT